LREDRLTADGEARVCIQAACQIHVYERRRPVNQIVVDRQPFRDCASWMKRGVRVKKGDCATGFSDWTEKGLTWG
jgi:hypothetical protein